MKNFLGRGFGFPVEVDAHGAFAMAEFEESVHQSVRIIIGTAPGERLMRPEFGCAIHNLVFHPNDPNTCAQAAMAVNDALVKWEPRIRDLSVRAYPSSTDENAIYITIEYRVRRTNNLHNLVYPFFLRREQDL